ncbi:MAG: nickel-responsive regulator 1 [Methanobacteriales archaeon Met13]
MAIISVSLSTKLLEEIDALKDEVGFSGRSEVIRAGARLLMEEQREKRELSGKINSILILIHPQKSEDQVTEIKHDFEDIVNTQIHSHLQEQQCLELFILEGDAQRIIQLHQRLNHNVKFLHSRLVTLPPD